VMLVLDRRDLCLVKIHVPYLDEISDVHRGRT